MYFLLEQEVEVWPIAFSLHHSHESRPYILENRCKKSQVLHAIRMRVFLTNAQGSSVFSVLECMIVCDSGRGKPTLERVLNTLPQHRQIKKQEVYGGPYKTTCHDMRW